MDLVVRRASDCSSDYDGACLQMRMSYIPAASFLLFLLQWTNCSLAGVLGLLRILGAAEEADGGRSACDTRWSCGPGTARRSCSSATSATEAATPSASAPSSPPSLSDPGFCPTAPRPQAHHQCVLYKLDLAMFSFISSFC